MTNSYRNHNKIRSRFKYFVFIILYFFLYPFCKLFLGREYNWLICERGSDAQDNGFIFFKYLLDNHPEIKPVYLLNKEAKEYKKVKALGKVVQFGSIKHFLMAIGFPVKISSNLFGYSAWVQMTTYFRRNKTNDCHVFLQHGITKNTHDSLFEDFCKSLDLFVCGTKTEYNFVFNEFHYKNSVPQYTGLARYDLLIDCKTKNQIIIMPTWRSSLFGVSDDVFVNSDFYKEWCSLISNNKLLETCRKNDLSIKFYLHYCFQRYSHLFKGNDVVCIVDFGAETVQNLLKESRLLITDFSSVYFDFGYMRKPIVYFQFDESTFNNEHYAKGYFDYRRDGFGDVCVKIDEAVDSIIKIINKDFNVEKNYINRMNSNFIYRDNKNCERIYNRIRELREKK